MAEYFIKKKENFICDNCGAVIIGDGYTNHCSKCLWSKHVDINPGDRAADCGGLMRPVGSESKNGEWRIIHKCEKCGYEKANRLSEGDNMDVFSSL